MKYRLGFVTNSSSSSFIISKKYLTPVQIKQINDYFEIAESVASEPEDEWGPTEFGWLDDDWGIEENDEYISGSCWMDSFNMYAFLKYIGVSQDNIKWYDFQYDLETLIRKENSNGER